MDDARRRLPGGWVLIEDDRIAGVGSGEPPATPVDRRLDAGGKVVAMGTPEQIAAVDGSHTGRFLKSVLR